MILRISIAVMIALIAFGTLRAEPQKLSLDKAVRIALKENYDLKSKSHDLNARRWGLRGAVTQFFPRVTFGTSASRVDETTNQIQNAPLEFFREFVPGITLIPRNSYSSDLTLTQPIYNGGSLWANLSVARSSMKASRHAYVEARLNTILDTKRAYFNVLRGEDLLEIWQQSVELANEYLRSAKVKHSLGMISNVEALRWELQLAENMTHLIQAENDLALAWIEFHRTIGSEPGVEYDLEKMSEDDISELLDSAKIHLIGDFREQSAEYETEALANSPAMGSVHASTAVRRALYRQKYSLFQPSINFSYSYMWETDDDIALDGIETWRASVVLSFPVFSSFGDYASLKESREDLKSGEAAEREFERTLLLKVAATAARMRTAFQQVEAARISRDISRENLKAVENRFEQGLIDNLNLIDAQIARTRSEAQYVSAVYDYMTAEAELDKLLGRQLY
ncbi:MAG: TolC family protein [Candidatus Zixiibacteriota bacterium]